jgi:hypothetical protein
MNTNNQTHVTRSAVEQITHNATTWIGHRRYDNNNMATGQTFLAPSEGDLDTIEVYSSIVTKPGKVTMTLHSFDPQQDKWGPSLGTATVEFNHNSNGKWIPFKLQGLHLSKGLSYGFKLESSETYIGVGEAAGSFKQPPFISGKEWRFVNNNQNPDAYSYFSLAFKVGLKAA